MPLRNIYLFSFDFFQAKYHVQYSIISYLNQLIYSIQNHFSFFTFIFCNKYALINIFIIHPKPRISYKIFSFLYITLIIRHTPKIVVFSLMSVGAVIWVFRDSARVVNICCTLFIYISLHVLEVVWCSAMSWPSLYLTNYSLSF